MKRYSIFFILSALVAIFSIACSHPEEQTQKPETDETAILIELVENNDGVKNSYVNSGEKGYATVRLEQGIAVATFDCETALSFTAGSASLLNVTDITTEECPALLEGVDVQTVNTDTFYSFDCRNCEVEFKGEWQRDEGISAWIGTIKVVPWNEGEGVTLFLVPTHLPNSHD